MDSTKCPKCLCEMEYLTSITKSGKDNSSYLSMTGHLSMTNIVQALLYKCPKCDYKKTVFQVL